MSRLIIPMLAVTLCFVSAAFSQSINLSDTVFYTNDWQRIKGKYADFYRPPVKRDSTGYLVEYYFKDHTPYIKGHYKSVRVDNHYSIEPQVAVMDGHFTYYYKNGNKRAEGVYANNVRKGTWKFYFFETGKIKSVQDYYTEQPVVYCIFYTKDSSAKLEEGMCVWVASKGDTSLQKEGQWIYYYRNTARIRCMVNFSLGLLDGDAVFYDSSTMNVKAKGTYKQGSKHGEWTYFDAVTKQVEGVNNYFLGLLDGKQLIYHVPSGKLKLEENYKKGVRTGLWKRYYRNGAVFMEADYADGVAHAVFFDSLSGKKIFEGAVENKKREGKWLRYYPNSTSVYSEEYYKENLLNGTVVTYNINGEKFEEVTYKEGIKNGICLTYYPGTKNILAKFEFRNDTPVGELSSYYPTGKLKRKRSIINNQLVEECFDAQGKTATCDNMIKEAVFPGDVMNYIGKNLVYPDEAKNAGIEGKVTIGFFIEETGKVSDAFVVSGFDSRCDAEALRLISEMPPWEPYMLEGLPCRSFKTLPVVFWIPEDEQRRAE